MYKDIATNYAKEVPVGQARMRISTQFWCIHATFPLAFLVDVVPS